MEKIVPYNTGKVQIGIHYEPRPMKFTDDNSSDFIQDLLFPHTAENTARNVLIGVCVGLAVFMLLYAYMFFWG